MSRIAAFSLAVWLLLSGCAPRTEPITRIALLAPFEGADRDIGYEALYAARLAVTEADDIWLDLLPIDDGADQGMARARALAADPLVKVVLLLGDQAASPEVQAAFDDLPVLIVGDWNAQPESANVILLPDEREADPAFIERYLAADQFAPQPRTLAAPVYDATVSAIAAVRTGSRETALAALTSRPE